MNSLFSPHYFWRSLVNYLFVLLSLGLSACSTYQHQQESTFHQPKEIQPAVEFWKKVYATWDLDQSVIHDNRHLNVVYEVVRLPQSAEESYQPTSRALVKNKVEAYKSHLANIEYKLQNRMKLSSEEKKTADLFKKTVGLQHLYGASERVRSQRGLKTRYHAGLERSYTYLPKFKEIFRNAGLPEDLVYLPHVESSFVNHAVSKSGAGGMWQFMPQTARLFLPMNHGVDGRKDPFIAAQGAAKYLQTAYKRLGSWPLALTSYNHGIGGMSRAKQDFGNDIGKIITEYSGKNFGFASRNFYPEFLAAREIALNAEQFFPAHRRHSPRKLDHIVLSQSRYPYDIAQQYSVPMTQLIALNPSWLTKAQMNTAPLPQGMIVWLPHKTLTASDRNNQLVLNK